MVLEYNRLNGVELKVEKLLQSQITLNEVSEHTGISESILKKLSSGEQSISNAKYTTVEALYNYYLERSDDIEAYVNKHSEHLYVKLPKKVMNLIEDIERAIQDVNRQKQSVDVAVKDIYSKKENGMVYCKKREFEINDLIGLGSEEVGDIMPAREPYRLSVRTQFFEHINQLNRFEIIFDKQKLIETLKQIKQDGGKISVEKSGYHNTRSIAVNPKNTSITKYKNYTYIGQFERFFMSIECD
ncbi:hypothetical protein H0243_14280 [Staphylococcus sciuri]|uniref:hypothetical protein n=1 Tax=Mammaliicoccus sciuri TaxID=1296 RepID=UPI0018CA71BF|nr:hypothetical protein [Mammaliicoccus sciuri]MBG9206958.1 hypothetical protein [Mammaliicoccus sciuri]